MHGAVDHRGGGPAAQQLVEEELGHFARVRRVAELALGREGIGFEPRQQAGRGRGDHVGLRVMQVGVDEAGHDQLAAVVVHGRRRPAASAASVRVVAGGLDLAAVDDQQAVLMPVNRRPA